LANAISIFRNLEFGNKLWIEKSCEIQRINNTITTI